MDAILKLSLEYLQAIPALWTEGLIGLWGVIGMILLHRYFGLMGLWAYTGIAAIAANIQVLKCIEIPFLEHPLALGTILFSTIFLANDWIVECYGLKEAKKGIALNLMLQLLFVGWMLLAVGVQVPDSEWLKQTHFEALFVPQVRILVAGWIAFLMGQWYDVLIYRRLKDHTKGRKLWLRAGLSYAIAVFIDNTVFSVLAWRWFAFDPISWEALIESYVIGIYILRLVLGLINVPLLYILRYSR